MSDEEQLPFLSMMMGTKFTMMRVNPRWGTTDAPGPKGLQRTFLNRKIVSLEGVPAKVRTKLEESCELHLLLRREGGLGLLVWQRLVWREQTI